jgi:hypothetical protein
VQKAWDKYTFSASVNIADTEVGNEKSSRYVYGSSATSIGVDIGLGLSPQGRPTNGVVGRIRARYRSFSIEVGGDDLVVVKRVMQSVMFMLVGCRQEMMSFH